MDIQEICNLACKDIKEGWEINIKIEKDAGDVELVDPDDCIREFDYSDMTIEEQIKECIRESHLLPV